MFMVSVLFNSVLLLGVSCCLSEKYTEAEDLFELATTSEPKNVVAWTMRGKKKKREKVIIKEPLQF